MKKLLVALAIALLPAVSHAITYQSVRASTSTTLTPTIQTGTMNLSSGTITNANHTNVNVGNTLNTRFLNVSSTASFNGVTGSTISYSSATFTNISAQGITASTITVSSLTATSANILGGTDAGTQTGPVSNAAAGYVLTSTMTASSATISNGSFLGITASTITATSSFTATSANIATGIVSNLTSSTATITTLVNNLWYYRRPTLQYVNASTVTVETGLTGTSGQAKVIFPDGTIYTESSSRLLNCDLTRNANFGNGTMQGGLRAGETIGNNIWYAIFVVKSTATGNTTDFVVVGTTLTAIQSNYSSLNTNFGTNGWVYLGLVRYGDAGSTATGILRFDMVGNTTKLSNFGTGANLIALPGMLLGTTAGATSITWTYASGMSGTVVPLNVLIGHVTFAWPNQTASSAYQTSGATGGSAVASTSTSSTNGTYATNVIVPLQYGLRINMGASTIGDMALTGFVDSVLGVGSNPQL